MRMGPLVLLVLMFVLTVPADAGAPSGIRGEVLNTTCYGPCSEPAPTPPRYTGEGLIVTVKELPDRARVAKLHPRNAAFELQVAPGAYRVRARVKDECWSGQRRRVLVDDSGYTTVTLHVQNDCIL